MGRRRATAEEVVDRFMDLNPGVSREKLTKWLKLEEDGVTVKIWNLYNLGLVELPEELCDLTITGDLYLNRNQITALPQSIGGMRIGRDLWLSNNRIATVPASMAQITVGGTLILEDNPMGQAVPECLRGTGINVRV